MAQPVYAQGTFPAQYPTQSMPSQSLKKGLLRKKTETSDASSCKTSFCRKQTRAVCIGKEGNVEWSEKKWGRDDRTTDSTLLSSHEPIAGKPRNPKGRLKTRFSDGLNRAPRPFAL
ncbi:hypothetical protein [Neisseria bacilliformis]|uniref:hypothetical protein n=1 Tax=Neisseria bacilliformis TaxID=267212 RepID=UPI0028EF8BFC|nr:hypothetical protein [Neisseria bacilliformis]